MSQDYEDEDGGFNWVDSSEEEEDPEDGGFDVDEEYVEELEAEVGRLREINANLKNKLEENSGDGNSVKDDIGDLTDDIKEVYDILSDEYGGQVPKSSVIETVKQYGDTTDDEVIQIGIAYLIVTNYFSDEHDVITKIE